MTRPRKREIVWGIRYKGRLLLSTIRATRKQVLNDSEMIWDYARKHGYSVHKLEVREVSK